MVTQDITSKFLIGCLIPIYITEEVVEYLGDCFVCAMPIELGHIAMFDWQRKLILHPIERQARVDCIAKYQKQHIADNPNVTNTQLMILFGISRRTAERRREDVR